MDIGCEFNAMCLMSKEEPFWADIRKIYNSRKGFDYSIRLLSNEEENTIHRCPDRHGAYRTLLEEDRLLAIDKNYEVRFIRTTALKHQRELDESSSAKNDIRDAYTIANIVREGKYIDTVIEDGVFRQLRTLAHYPPNRWAALVCHAGQQRYILPWPQQIPQRLTVKKFKGGSRLLCCDVPTT